MLEVLLDSLLDFSKVLGISFVLFVLISFLEDKIFHIFSHHPRLSPLIGSGFGLIPQCGFSVIGADLYHQKIISFGAVLAVFFSCSDEALPILLCSPSKAWTVVPLLVCKFVFGCLLGYTVDLILPPTFQCEEEPSRNKHHYTGFGFKHFLEPFFHALKISLYFLIVSFLFGTVIYFVTEERLYSLMSSQEIFSPLWTCLIGLIPNCASSVVITELYLENAIPFGALFSGLCVNAGLGIFYLLRLKEERKKVFFFTLVLFGYSLVLGYAFMGIGLLWR